MSILDIVLGTASSHGYLAVCVALLVYWSQLAVRRLFLSPIAHIPGPKLAAMTQLYESYYDIWLGGQYTLRILEMHKQYGPIVRISPWEVHVGDADFFNELYAGSGRRRERWSFFTKQFGADQSTLSTIDHDHHRLRRSALNPFFSNQGVKSLQPVIEERADTLLERLQAYGQTSSKPLNIMYPFSAFTNDVICEYSFARSEHLIEDAQFGKQSTECLLMGTHMGPIIKHVGSIGHMLVNSLPDWFSARYVPGWSGFLKLKKDIRDQINEIKATEHTEKWQLDVDHPTIFHEMLSSKVLPPEEKTVTRLAHDGQILVQAGTLTTSWTIAVATFHLLNRPESLTQLRDELFERIPDPNEVVPLARLEQFPYLRAVIKEALRLAFGTSSRLSRVAPDETMQLFDKEKNKTWKIPPGTVVSMTSYKTQTDPTIYYDPFGWHPERWIEDGGRQEKDLPVFNAGSRVCLGIYLAEAELYLMIAKLFRRWGGGGAVGGHAKEDKRVGDMGKMKLFDTSTKDCEMAADYFIPIPYKGSRGLRVVFEPAKN
ncbi:Cytochrome p450 [Zalerion maritima]|uniref:Cytochrome p450 n=1 Tax=Zalerion maritima TaxID=339359 RepID=A0AAD5RTE1_9PEZI|nr:Cytochrome p450 [Zalerion maritima]